MKKLRVLFVIAVIGATAFLFAFAPGVAPAATLTVRYSSVSVATGDLDGNPATGDWSDVTGTIVPLENGQPNPYGTVTAYLKHDGTYLYIRLDGKIDVPWTSATGTHFWLGFLLGPASVTGHHKTAQDLVFFGETTFGGVTYPLAPIDAYGGGKPPTKDSSQDAVGTLRYAGTSAPYSFTAEWRRPLNSGDSQDVALVPDGVTSYVFSITTDSNGKGSSGGSVDHAVVTNDNILRLERPSTGDLQPPSVSIDAPQNGSAVLGTVLINVTASDNVAVDHVDLFINETKLGSDNAQPYQFPWDTSAIRNGPYRLTATAFDASYNNATEWILVQVSNPDLSPPTANAGPDRAVPPGIPVTLDGSGSTDNQGVVSWAWSFTDLVPVSLLGAVVTYTFSRNGHYLVTLTVSDAAGNSADDAVWVNVTADTAPPVAVAGPDQTVLPGSNVTLNGSRSMDDVAIVNYTWSWVDAVEVRLYGPVVSRVFEREGPFLVTLTVRDYVGNSAADTLWVNVTMPVDWSTSPTTTVTTTEGKFLQESKVQVATDGGQLFFHANFTYAGSVTDPESVYFAVEFDRAGKAFPMSAGDEMIILSKKGPDGLPATNYSYYVAEDQSRPIPIAASQTKLISYRVQDRAYDIVFSRPLEAADPAHQAALLPGSAIKVAFAIGEWGKGDSHSYTLMAWKLTITEGGASLEKLGGADPTDIYRLASTLGQTVLFVTLGIVAFHAVRRRVWRGKHPVEVYCAAGEKVPVERHSLGVRVLHWAHVGLMSIFIATGWSIFVKDPVLGPNTVPVHIVVSFLILAIDYPLHFYFMWRSGEIHFLFLPWKDDLVVAVSLITNFFGLSKKYEEHATVDPETGEWYKGRKYCSFQKGLLLMDLAAMFVMALSGYALYWPGQFTWLYDFLRPWGGYFVIRGFHLLMFYYFVSTLIAHAYLSFIPMNWGKLRSIVKGRGLVHTHRKEAPPPAPVIAQAEER